MSSNDSKYNGWTNRSTWNASLWLNNDCGLYQLLQEQVEAAGSVSELASALESMCQELWGKSTPDGDRLASVDWHEIAEAEME